MRSFAFLALALTLSQLASSCKTPAYERQRLQARSLDRDVSLASWRDQGLDAAMTEDIENLPGLGLGQSGDRLGKSAWTTGKFKVSASCRDTFHLTIEGLTIRNVTNFQPFEGCVALASLIDKLELPSAEPIEDTPIGGLRVTSSCRDEYFTLRVSEGNVHISSDYLVPNAEACQELRNRINGLKL
ncbi:MAG TPA: hypothetical protein VE954_26625 [Oligoflexus sp.]|uniref:hypothetical protein n=1 Tax=Oligoflexus sp. TaxID=1971216 RepID=UPI002D272537|nr:hypothetical protein [Oligoflexus sp.]HYX36701.1 hypothetical protein [Oligoflexus sp.]